MFVWVDVVTNLSGEYEFIVCGDAGMSARQPFDLKSLNDMPITGKRYVNITTRLNRA
jgi:hypothetical protein